MNALLKLKNKIQMQKLLDRYRNLERDYARWLEKNIEQLGCSDITFKRPFLLGRHFVVHRLYYNDTKYKWCVEGGVIHDILEDIPIGNLNLKEMDSLIFALIERGYFND